MSTAVEITGPDTCTPRVLEGRALMAVVCHGALPGGAAVRLKSPRGSRRARSMGRITIRNHWKCSQAICTVVSATCNSHVLLHRQRPIVEVVHEVDAETVSRRRRYRTWQGAVNVEQCVSVQMRSDAVVEPSLGREVECAFERDDREHSAAVVEPVDLGVLVTVCSASVPSGCKL